MTDYVDMMGLTLTGRVALILASLDCRGSHDRLAFSFSGGYPVISFIYKLRPGALKWHVLYFQWSLPMEYGLLYPSSMHGGMI